MKSEDEATQVLGWYDDGVKLVRPKGPPGGGGMHGLLKSFSSYSPRCGEAAAQTIHSPPLPVLQKKNFRIPPFSVVGHFLFPPDAF